MTSKLAENLPNIILGVFGLAAVGFVIFMLVGLANYKGYQGKARRGKDKPAVAAVAGKPRETRKSPTRPSSPAEIAEVNLRRLLLRLSRMSQLSRRRKIIQVVRARLEEFEDPLLEILEDETEELIVTAIELVEAVDLKRAALALTILTDAYRVPVRAAAIRAREKLSRWNDTELTELLQQSDHGVLTVVLRIVMTRDQRPVPRLIELLRHPKASVRRLAADAIPKLDPGPDLDALCSVAAHAKSPAARAAARALGKPALSQTAEECLIQLLGHADWIVRQSSLISLANKGVRLQNIDPILAAIMDTRRPLRERVYGFLAMEKTGPIPVSNIKSMMPRLHPVLQLFGARCLLAAGDRAGVSVLIELLATKESKTVDCDDCMCVHLESEQLLREISGRDFGSGRDAWHRWYRETATIAPRKLRRPAPTFW